MADATDSDTCLLTSMVSASANEVSVSHPAGCPGRIGEYQVRRIIGAGRSAIVYQACDLQDGREVAIKVPRQPWPINEAERQQFDRELRRTTELDHQHIVPTYEVVADASSSFIASEFCTGPTLAAWLKSHQHITPVDAAKLVAEMADAVAYSHAHGILHRHLKPANVLLFPNDSTAHESFPFIPKLSDFGFASFITSPETDLRVFKVLKAPLHLAPEQVVHNSSASGTVTDIFGLGGILYELLTGSTPFAGKTVIDVLESIRTGKMKPVRKLNPQIPRDLAVICEKAIAISPTNRYSSAADLRDDLQRFLNGKSIRGRPVGSVIQSIRSLLTVPAVDNVTGKSVLSHAVLLSWICLLPIILLLMVRMAPDSTMSELTPYVVPFAILYLISCIFCHLIGDGKYWLAITLMLLGGFLSLSSFQS